MFASVLDASVLGKARQAGLVTVDFVSPRDFATDKHRSVDDTPYGGGPGMVMKCEQMMAALESVVADEGAKPHRVLLSPVGKSLTQARVRELAELAHLVLVCGRYEGIDQRVIDLGIDESLSIGDYVLTGGELGAMVMIDAIARYLPGVLGHSESAEDESFSDGLLEYPQYTRPAVFRGLEVPEVLFSGHHARIQEWRKQRSVERTAEHRPDLIAAQVEILAELASRTYVVLAHHPVLDRNGKTVTTSVTNFDIHDIARSCATYALAGYFPISPIALQREKIARIIEIWRKEIRQAGADARGRALAGIEVMSSVEDAIEQVRARHGQPPWVVATSAQPATPDKLVDFAILRAERVAAKDRPLILILGTGWGLGPSVISLADQMLAPLRGPGNFNHLSVRSAAAAMLDRLFGIPLASPPL